MKKIVTLLLMVSILVSCSDWKYSNGVKRQKRSYTYSNPNTPVENEIIAESEKNSSFSDKENEPQNQPLETVESTSEMPNVVPETMNNETILVNRKTLEFDEDSIKPVNQGMVDEAIDAEDKGRKSRNFGIVGLILQITYIFALVGLVFSIIGLIKGIQSLRANYNTPKGVSMARTGIILSSITIGLYLLSIIAIVLIIIAFI